MRTIETKIFKSDSLNTPSIDLEINNFLKNVNLIDVDFIATDNECFYLIKYTSKELYKHDNFGRDFNIITIHGCDDTLGYNINNFIKKYETKIKIYDFRFYPIDFLNDFYCVLLYKKEKNLLSGRSRLRVETFEDGLDNIQCNRYVKYLKNNKNFNFLDKKSFKIDNDTLGTIIIYETKNGEEI